MDVSVVEPALMDTLALGLDHVLAPELIHQAFERRPIKLRLDDVFEQIVSRL